MILKKPHHHPTNQLVEQLHARMNDWGIDGKMTPRLAGPVGGNELLILDGFARQWSLGPVIKLGR